MIMGGSWNQLKMPFAPDTALLLTDGSVICHEFATPKWHRLVPESDGTYMGSWSATAPMLNDPAHIPSDVGGLEGVYAPYAFASAVLVDGKLIVAGGEYNFNPGTIPADGATPMQLYDPASNSWSIIEPPLGWQAIGDAPSCVLADGRLLLGCSGSGTLLKGPNAAAIYEKTGNTWAFAKWAGANGPRTHFPSEETWTLLPDGSVLAIDCVDAPATWRYVPAADAWVSAGDTVPTLALVTTVGDVAEIGPAILLPDGRVFQLGAASATGFYKLPAMSGGQGWTAGPVVPSSPGHGGSGDAAACLLPNGHVLFAAGVLGGGSLWEFDPSPASLGSINQVAPPLITPGFGSVDIESTRMLLLPSGQVLMVLADSGAWLYTPDSGPIAAWQPTITQAPSVITPGRTYALYGTQLNGLSQACSYGDDAQMATNYPILRLRRRIQPEPPAPQPPEFFVIYLRTFNHSTMGVATGSAIQSTQFEIPAGTRFPISLPAHPVFPNPPKLEYFSEDWVLEVVANGIVSEGVAVTVEFAQLV
jgi:hypothetical protein